MGGFCVFFNRHTSEVQSAKAGRSTRRGIEGYISECDVPEFVPLDNDKLYDIVLSNFLLTGGDGYKMIRDYAIQKHVVGEAIQTLKLATLYHERVIHYRLLTEYPKILWPSEVVVKWNEFASSSAQRPKASIFLIDHSKHFFFS